MNLQTLATVGTTAVLLLIVAASVGLSAYLVLTQVTERIVLRSRLRPATRRTRTPGEVSRSRRNVDWLLPSTILQQMQSSYEERRSLSALPLSWSVFVTVSLAGAAVGLLIGLLHFGNVLAGIALGVMGLFLPDQILAIGAGVHKDKTNEQFQMAVQIFAAEYRAGRSVQRAFLMTVPQLPEPIRSHFERAARRLNNGEPTGDVLDELARRLRHPFARLFVNNCRAVMENQRSKDVFDKIAYQLNQWRIRQTSNAAAIAGGRTTALLLNGALPVVYLVQVRLQPMTHTFLTETAGGRGLLVLMLVGVLLSFGLNNYLAKAEW